MFYNKSTKEVFEELKSSLEVDFSKLHEQEKNIINMRFYKGKTQMEIAAEIGISQAQVSRLEKGAISRIRKVYK